MSRWVPLAPGAAVQRRPGRLCPGAAVPRRRGATLVEVLVALALVAIQVPALVATIGAAAALSRRAESIVATIDAASFERCRTP